MSSQRIELLTPVGRLVMGSLYHPQTKDAEGNLLIIKTGANAGQPKVVYFFALAIEKKGEKHWNETEWGKKIWEIGKLGFPQGQYNSPTFAWKIVDGDSNVPNKAGKKPCDRDGYVGNWVLSFSSGFAPGIFQNLTGKLQALVEEDAINLGDYVQVYSLISPNDSAQQPGVYLNHSKVCLLGYGERIVLGIDPEDIGFGVNVQLPSAASKTPMSSGFSSVTTPTPSASPVAVTPYPEILNAPPPSPKEEKKLTEKAQGATYEQLLAAGWTDMTLVQHGLMVE